MSRYDGSRVRSLVGHGVDHVFGLVLFEQYIYWTDWQSQSVHRAHKFSGQNQSELVKKLHHWPMGIKVVWLVRL